MLHRTVNVQSTIWKLLQMIKYKDLVEYIKANHVNWDTELFSVLRGFFEQYTAQSLPSKTFHDFDEFTKVTDFQPPANGEYSTDDVLGLFST